MARSFCIVTKTYHGDAGAFADLCRSIDRHMPDITHYVLVDRSDLALFAPYGSDRRKVIDCSALLPKFREFNLAGKRLWWRWPTRIVRGWIYQQLAKISFTATLTEDAALLIDSDALFVRPVAPEQIFSGERVKLWRSPEAGKSPEHSKWHDVAMKSFGKAAVGYTGFDYISNAVIWSPPVVAAMIAKIESVSDRKWFDVLTANFRFSEYIQYGVFCDHVEGAHQQGIVPTEQELCHCSWHYDINTPEGVADFAGAIEDYHCAVLIQSNLKLEDHERRTILAAVAPGFT